MQKKIFNEYIKKELIKQGIDIDNDDYINNSGYKILRKRYIAGCEEDFITWDYYIEKYLVGEERINKIKKGKYDIGTKRKLVGKDLEYESLFKDIAEFGLADDENVVGHLIRQNIKRPDGGLLARLSKNLKLGLEKFENEQINKFKLLKLLYVMEHKYNVNIIMLLNNPSLENVDNALVGIKTVNGEIVSELKNEIMKEVCSGVRKKIKDALFVIVSDWTKQIQKIAMYIDLSVKQECYIDLNRIENYLADLVEQISRESINISYKHSLFETFYLKLLQYENIGKVKDIIRINESIRLCENNLNVDSCKKMETLLHILIKFDSMVEYLNNKENLRYIAQNVCFSEKLSSNQLRKIKNSIVNVIKLLKWIKNNTSLEYEKGVSLLLLVSCFQEVVNLNKKEKFENHYHGYTTPEPTLSAELNRDEAREANKNFWVKKVINRLNHNRGLTEVVKVVSRIEILLDKIMCKILEYHNVEDMLYLHTILMKHVDRELVSRNLAISLKNEFQKKLHIKSGYILEVYNDDYLNFFKEIQTSTVDDQIITQLKNWILEAEEQERNQMVGIPFELISENDALTNEYVVIFLINIKQKKVVLDSFKFVYNRAYIEKLIELNMSALIK